MFVPKTAFDAHLMQNEMSLLMKKARAFRTQPDTVQSRIGRHYCNTSRCLKLIGHVNNIPTLQFFTGFSRNTQSKSYMIS